MLKLQLDYNQFIEMSKVIGMSFLKMGKMLLVSLVVMVLLLIASHLLEKSKVYKKIIYCILESINFY